MLYMREPSAVSPPDAEEPWGPDPGIIRCPTPRGAEAGAGPSPAVGSAASRRVVALPPSDPKAINQGKFVLAVAEYTEAGLAIFLMSGDSRLCEVLALSRP